MPSPSLSFSHRPRIHSPNPGLAHLRVPNAEALLIPVAPLRNLLGRDRKTNLRFGDDAAVTVCSQKRVPAVLSQTAVLSDDFYELLDEANLDEATQEKSRYRSGRADSWWSYFLFLIAG
ncbi:MAG: hypothetical protein EXS40_01335 [Opitutaceae bacterium]|nr:hypothetical protein [Opitutaceae bacterium]